MRSCSRPAASIQATSVTGRAWLQQLDVLDAALLERIAASCPCAAAWSSSAGARCRARTARCALAALCAFSFCSATRWASFSRYEK